MLIRSVQLCNNGEFSSSVVLIITIIETVAVGWVLSIFCCGCPMREHYTPSQHDTHITEPPPSPATISIIVIIKTTEDEISPSLHNRIDLINTDTLSDENLMMAGLG